MVGVVKLLIYIYGEFRCFGYTLDFSTLTELVEPLYKLHLSILSNALKGS